MKSIILLLAIFVAQGAQASYLEACQIGTTVKSVSDLKHTSGTNPHYTKEVVAEVIKVEKDNGSHMGCDHLIGQELKMDLTSVSLLALVQLKPGYYASVDRFYANSMTPDGFVEGSTHKLMNNALVAYNAVLSDKDVYKAISDMRLILQAGIGNGVILLKGEVVSLPEGLCGVVGCDETFLVSLTYGENYMNSSRLTLVMKVSVSALGESINIKIIDNPVSTVVE